MQPVNAYEIFKNIDSLYNSEFEASKDIMLDFSNVENIDLKGITALLDIQKVAIMNKKTLSIKNAKPDILNVLDVTGLNKTFINFASNPIKGN